MTAISLVGQERFAFDRQRIIATIFVMLGLVDIFVFGLYSNGDAVFTFTLTGASGQRAQPGRWLPPRCARRSARSRSCSASSTGG